MEYDQLSVSDGTGEAVLANIESDRAIASITIDVDSVENFPDEFIFATGTKNVNNFITPASMTVGYGHLDSGNVIIDGFAPGYADDGNTAGQILIIKPTTFWADEIVRLARIAHEDNGDLKRDAIDTAASGEEVGLLGATHYYTYVSPDVFIDGVNQNNGDNTVDWTKPAGLKFVIVEVQAGGGGGAGNPSTANTAAGGGGGGGYALVKVPEGSLGATEVVTVGAKGAGGAVNTVGATGGASSFGAHAIAGGGVGGAVAGNGGAGGTGTSGNLLIKGGGGTAAAVVGPPTGGAGGSARLGGGAPGLQGSAAGASAGNYGGGGGGGSRIASGGQPGGDGGGGIVIIHEYY